MAPRDFNHSWGFRVASAPQLGAGHMRRCMALAEALDGKACFFLDPEAPWTTDLEKSGIEIEVEESIESTSLTMGAIYSGRIRGIIFDSYELPRSCIDDAANYTFTAEIADKSRPTSAQAIVVPALGVADSPQPNLDNKTHCLIGPSFTLLAAPFVRAQEIASSAERSLREIRNVLVSMSAYDSVNATGFVLEALAQATTKFDVSITLGPNAPHIELVKSQVERMGKRATLIMGADDLSGLLLESDLVIAAGGVTLIEACCCGTPAITVPFNDNQCDPAKEVERLGVGVFAGLLSEISTNSLASLVDDVASDYEGRQKMHKNGLSLIDGKGTERVAAALQNARDIYYAH